MAPRDQSSWVVLKFGGTSVSNLANWRNIAAVVRSRLAAGTRVLVVHSAVSGITDRLETLLVAALAGTHEATLTDIEQRHSALAGELGIGASAALEHYFSELRHMAAGIALMGEVSDRTRARVLSSGELMATELGARYLAASGLEAQWWDARRGLNAEQRVGASVRANFLSASCDYSPDSALRAQLDALSGVIVTQGFIASDAAGDTVLLGRGGSDTSAAYLAAKLVAERLEIWTDVPGLFSANPRATPHARLLRSLHYDEAQEIASSGAKVLHPRCILPAKSQRIPIAIDQRLIEALIGDLSQLCRVQVLGPCASVSLVGRNIRGILHQLGAAFELFAEQRVYLLSQAANDLNFSFVVDESQGDRLVNALHERLIRPVRTGAILGPTWEQLFARPEPQPAPRESWWRARRAELLALAAQHDCAYVYDPAVIVAAAQALKGLQSVERVLYAMKANPNAQILRLLAAEGLGFECVSRGEIEHLLASVPGLDRSRILFTPNFAGREEYRWALEAGITLTLDNLYVLRNWGELFRARSVFIRIDTGTGRGHHHHVRTAGAHAKFGVPLAELHELGRLVERHGAIVVGLHAHSGSGIFNAENWSDVATCLLDLEIGRAHV